MSCLTKTIPMGFVSVLLFVLALIQIVQAYDYRYAVCVACWSEQVQAVDPCANIRSKVTSLLNKRFTALFQKYNATPSSYMWVPEPNTFINQTNATDITTPSNDTIGVGYNDTVMIGNQTTDLLLKDTDSSPLARHRRRKLGKTVSCRSYCSTYPDCSAWCPNNKRRHLRTRQHTYQYRYSSLDGPWTEDDDALLGRRHLQQEVDPYAVVTALTRGVIKSSVVVYKNSALKYNASISLQCSYSLLYPTCASASWTY